MSKKRPGYQAGSNLLQITDAPEKWEHLEKLCEPVILENLTNLQDRQDALQVIIDEKDKTHFTPQELDHIIHWKHTVGKNRGNNARLVQSNEEETVQTTTHAAILIARSIGDTSGLQEQEEDEEEDAEDQALIKNAMKELLVLQGVGPATASAMLTLVRPDAFCYMYDEVIDSMGTEISRDYSLPQYLRINGTCTNVAKQLNQHASTTQRNWTANRVARIVFMACKYMAIKETDPTASLASIPKKITNRFLDNNNKKRKPRASGLSCRAFRGPQRKRSKKPTTTAPR